MSEPARSLPPLETGGRTAPGPLRDWLAAMKAHTPAEPRPAARPEPKLARGIETAWAPRLVQASVAPPAPTSLEDHDVAELMAENLVLKAKLRVEGERQGELQTMLAGEIRELRQHIRDEMGSMGDLRSEQEAIQAEREGYRSERERIRAEYDDLRAERDRAVAERDAVRMEHEALAAERDALREERDIWRARTETLAQPLFQLQTR